MTAAESPADGRMRLGLARSRVTANQRWTDNMQSHRSIPRTATHKYWNALVVLHIYARVRAVITIGTEAWSSWRKSRLSPERESPG